MSFFCGPPDPTSQAQGWSVAPMRSGFLLLPANSVRSKPCPWFPQFSSTCLDERYGAPSASEAGSPLWSRTPRNSAPWAHPSPSGKPAGALPEYRSPWISKGSPGTAVPGNVWARAITESARHTKAHPTHQRNLTRRASLPTDFIAASPSGADPGITGGCHLRPDVLRRRVIALR